MFSNISNYIERQLNEQIQIKGFTFLNWQQCSPLTIPIFPIGIIHLQFRGQWSNSEVSPVSQTKFAWHSVRIESIRQAGKEQPGVTRCNQIRAINSSTWRWWSAWNSPERHHQSVAANVQPSTDHFYWAIILVSQARAAEAQKSRQ